MSPGMKKPIVSVLLLINVSLLLLINVSLLLLLIRVIFLPHYTLEYLLVHSFLVVSSGTKDSTSC